MKVYKKVKKMKELKFRQRRKWYSFTEGHIPEKDYWHYWPW